MFANKLFLKQMFVELNGGMLRLVGRRICNERIRYRNGMLGGTLERNLLDVETRDRAVKEVVAFNHALKCMEIPFLFVLVPAKKDFEVALLPEGYRVSSSNLEAAKVVSALAECGVHTLDLAPVFAATPASVTRSFFATDHHWRYRTALSAARLVANELSDLLSIPKLRDHPRLKEEKWRWKMLPRSFLGSGGRRTGRLFAGLDDFEYAVPKFRVTLERKIPSKKVRKRGDFKKAEIIAALVDPKAEPSVNRYAAYTGGDVDVQRHVNANAPVSTKVLLVKDSFGNPVAAFWATVFKEVIQVDTRKLSQGTTVLDIVERYRPNVVVELVNPGFLAGCSLGIPYESRR